MFYTNSRTFAKFLKKILVLKSPFCTKSYAVIIIATMPYKVIRQLPEEAGEFSYRIKSVHEGYERAVKESQIEKA